MKRLRVLGRHDHGHALLALRDGQLGAVQTLVLAWDTAFRSMCRPSASSPMATDTPPAPKSLQRLIRRRWPRVAEQALQLALDRARCPSAPRHRRSQGSSVYAPWRNRWHRRQPSRPVRPPSRMTTSPGAGSSRRTLAGRRCADNCADLHALGGVAGVVQLVRP